MTPTVRELTVQAIYDALSLAGPGDGGGFIRTAAECYMTGERRALALEVLKHLPPGTMAATVERIADDLVPVIRAVLTPAT